MGLTNYRLNHLSNAFPIRRFIVALLINGMFSMKINNIMLYFIKKVNLMKAETHYEVGCLHWNTYICLDITKYL